MGRPTIYSDEMVERSKEYVALCEDEIKQVISGESEKFTTYKDKVVVKLPTIEGLALYLGIHKDTIYQWEKDDDKQSFSDVINVLRVKQAERLINMGLSGDYNPIIAKVLLSKHGYTEKIDNELSGAVDLSKKPTWFDYEKKLPDDNIETK